jgi:hypothetical protein
MDTIDPDKEDVSRIVNEVANAKVASIENKRNARLKSKA